jgi:hypothetical protein
MHINFLPDLLPGERDFFVNLAEQAEMSLEELEEEISDCDIYPKPWVTVNERGHVIRVDLTHFNSPIESLDVSALTHLETLDCGWDDNLRYRYHREESSGGPALRALVLGRLPHLRRLDAGTWLRPGTPRGTRIGTLDVTGLPALEFLNVADCGLDTLDVRQNPNLQMLIASNNPLTSLDVSGRKALTYLNCGSEGYRTNSVLRTLDISGCSSLQTLACCDSPLSQLDLSDAPALEKLDITRTRLTQIDLRRNKRLREVKLVGCKTLKTIDCHELQKQVIPSLRTFFKLSKPTKDPATMDPFTLHAWADQYNWDEGTKKLLAAIRNPSCSLATALLIYWRAKPHWFLQYVDDRAALAARQDPDVLKLIREIEQRVAENAYQHHPFIAWTPGDMPVDPYPEYEKKRTLLRLMLEISAAEHRVADA